MANVFTQAQVEAFIPGKTWNDLSLDMQMSAIAYVYAQLILRYYVVVPPLRVDELTALVGDRYMRLDPVPLASGVLVLPFDTVMDLDTFGYAHTFLSSLIIRFVDDSEFPPDTSGI